MEQQGVFGLREPRLVSRIRDRRFGAMLRESNRSFFIRAETPPTPERVFPRIFPFRFATKANRGGRCWKSTIIPLQTAAAPQKFALKDAKGRFVKVEATRLSEVEQGRYYFQLAEIEVFGKEASADPLEVKPSETAERTRVCGGCAAKTASISPAWTPNRPAFPGGWNRPIAARSKRPPGCWSPRPWNCWPKNKADYWDSGKMAGDRSVAVVYAGKPLPSGKPFGGRSCSGTRTASRRNGASRTISSRENSSRKIGKAAGSARAKIRSTSRSICGRKSKSPSRSNGRPCSSAVWASRN